MCCSWKVTLRPQGRYHVCDFFSNQSHCCIFISSTAMKFQQAGDRGYAIYKTTIAMAQISLGAYSSFVLASTSDRCQHGPTNLLISHNLQRQFVRHDINILTCPPRPAQRFEQWILKRAAPTGNLRPPQSLRLGPQRQKMISAQMRQLRRSRESLVRTIWHG